MSRREQHKKTRAPLALAFFCALAVGGCAATIVPPNDFEAKEIQTETFKLMTCQKITDSAAPVKIYIEGDGHAFYSDGMATNNPSPRTDFMRKLAFGDASKNVVYLARPCQFVADPICQQNDWTTARFSARAVDSSAMAIKNVAGKRPVILIGFSGGAQIAGLVTVLHPEIKVQKLITISGNLDHKAWTENHNLPPLTESLNLADYKTEFAKIPQMHFIGADDKVIPMEITENFINDPSKITVIPNAGHGTGFENIFPTIWNEK